MGSEKGVLATADLTVPGFSYCLCAPKSLHTNTGAQPQEGEPTPPTLCRCSGNVQPTHVVGKVRTVHRDTRCLLTGRHAGLGEHEGGTRHARKTSLLILRRHDTPMGVVQKKASRHKEK